MNKNKKTPRNHWNGRGTFNQNHLKFVLKNVGKLLIIAGLIVLWVLFIIRFLN